MLDTFDHIATFSRALDGRSSFGAREPFHCKINSTEYYLNMYSKKPSVYYSFLFLKCSLTLEEEKQKNIQSGGIPGAGLRNTAIHNAL